MGAKLDILFEAGVYELGSCEVGKHDVEISDDKYLNDSLLKLPKTLKDMLVAQVKTNSCYINSLTTVGYLMMGLHMELVTLNIPKGKHVARVTKTERFPFPCSAEGLSTDFISLLELTWRGSQMMEENLLLLKRRKRKEVELITNDDKAATLTPSFGQHQH